MRQLRPTNTLGARITIDFWVKIQIRKINVPWCALARVELSKPKARTTIMVRSPSLLARHCPFAAFVDSVVRPQREAKLRASRRLVPFLVSASLKRRSRSTALSVCIAAGTVAAGLAFAQSAMADPTGLAVQLNKLESEKDGCRAYFVISNNSSTAYKVLKLDLIQFQPDGVIGRRFAVDLGPLKPEKRTVKLFDINTPCDQVGSLMINDVVECSGEAGSLPNCLADLTVSSLAQQQLSK
jgi:hypothetical protein